MKNISHFKNMPQLLAALVLLGLLAPFLALYSVLTGSIVSGGANEYAYGAAKDIYELGGVVLFAVPIFISSLLMLRKKKVAIAWYLFGWLAICLSPLCLSEIQESSSIYLKELLMYIVLGVAIGVFLFKSKEVKSYFLSE